MAYMMICKQNRHEEKRFWFCQEREFVMPASEVQIIHDRVWSRQYVVFLFKAEKYSGTLTSSSEGRVFWAEIDEVPDLPWIWGMDSLMKIFVDGEYSELFLSAEDEWEPVLK